MALTDAGIYEVILNRLGELGGNVTDMSEELVNVLFDLSSRDDFLKSSETIVTEDGTPNYDIPTSYKDTLFIYRSGGRYLDRASGGYDAYLKYIENDSTPYESKPVEFCVYNDDIWLMPIPDAEYSLTHWYSKFHNDSTDTIEFGDRFSEAIYEGVLALLYKGQLAQAQNALVEFERHTALFEMEIRKLKGTFLSEPHVIKYRDMG